jgi:hypothetical protein
MPDVFWRQTWRENALIAESYHNKINLDWERSRYIATMVYNVNCSKKSQMIKPQDLFLLPVDKLAQNKRNKPKSTPEQMKAFADQYEATTEHKAFKF